MPRLPADSLKDVSIVALLLRDDVQSMVMLKANITRLPGFGMLPQQPNSGLKIASKSRRDMKFW